MPVTPSTTTSGTDPRRSATTGVPQAMASIMTIPNGSSHRIGKTSAVLLFTGRYPKPLYDFVMGMDRWALRLAAYTALMTDRYPPFRLDLGGTDPGWVLAGPIPPWPSGVPVGAPPAPPVPAR